MPMNNHAEPSDWEASPVTDEMPVDQARTQVEAISDDLAAQLESITAEFDAVRREVDRIKTETEASMNHLPKLVDQHLKDLAAQGTTAGRKGVIRRHSAYNSQGKVPTPRALHRSISWDPQVRDNAKRPGEDSLSDIIRRQSMRNRQRRRQQSSERSFGETLLWCLVVVVLSNFLPQILQSFIALGSSGHMPGHLDD